MPVSPFKPFAIERSSRSLSSGYAQSPATLAEARDAAEIGAITQQRLDDIYRSQGKRLHRFLRGQVGDDAAHDMVHDAFTRMAASQRVHLLVEPAAYLWTVARNLLFERKRKQKRGNIVYLPPCEDRDPACAPEQEWSLEEADLLTLYRQAVESLPEKTRRVFVMRRIEDLSHREISLALGVTVATVEYHMGRALTHIAKVVEAGR